MEPTQEQRTYARLGGVLMLVRIAMELGGDFPTIIARGGATFAQTASYIVENPVLWRAALLSVGIAWLLGGVLGFVMYVVLEPVDKRLAQLALVLRLGTSLVGGASLMFRVANVRVHTATTAGQFTTEQLATLSGVMQTGANGGVYLSWILMGLGGMIWFVLFRRSRYLPGWLVVWGLIASALLIGVPMVGFVYPSVGGTLKPILLISLLSDITTAIWLSSKGLTQSPVPRSA